MPKDRFLRFMEESLQLEPRSLKGPELLRINEQWDSQAVLDFMTMADAKTGRTPEVDAIARCVTFDDLYSLLEN
jgi:hypothetical protein